MFPGEDKRPQAVIRPGGLLQLWQPQAPSFLPSFFPPTSSSRLCGDACFVSHGPERVPFTQANLCHHDDQWWRCTVKLLREQDPRSKLSPPLQALSLWSLSPGPVPITTVLWHPWTPGLSDYPLSTWFVLGIFLEGGGLLFHFVFCFTNYSSQSFPFSINNSLNAEEREWL